MSGARLKSSLLVQGLMRQAQAEGGFAAIITKGDAESGSMLVILAEKGRKARILERLLQPNGHYAWQDVGVQALSNAEDTEKFLVRRRNFDPDLWILELDVASVERFAAQMSESV